MKTFATSTAFFRTTQIKRDESDSQKLTTVLYHQKTFQINDYCSLVGWLCLKPIWSQVLTYTRSIVNGSRLSNNSRTSTLVQFDCYANDVLLEVW